MNFQQIPEIFELLKAENLTALEVNGENLVCANSSGEKFLMKESRGTEEQVYVDVFPVIERMNLQFGRLELPKHSKVVTKTLNGKRRKIIFLNYYEGVRFNDTWNEGTPEGYGGRAIDISLADKVVEILEDFAKIDTTQLISFSLPTFNFTNWKSLNFPHKAQSLTQHGILTQSQVQKLQSVIDNTIAFQNSLTIFTNGDFYPRNFIDLPTGKLLVIDWEGRLDYELQVNNNGVVQNFPGQRNALINYLENHLAFFFVHMWGNYPIQRKVMKSAFQKFNLNKESLQIGIIIKSLEQSHAFIGSYLAVRLAEMAINAMDMNYIEDLVR
ncbi:MAG TPA: hypothetical protein VEW42_04025 [Candidatus Eisenbacteria bacterium]|nr:hypothetical protein [Candidatus Eisenbacteria bacterium]